MCYYNLCRTGRDRFRVRLRLISKNSTSSYLPIRRLLEFRRTTRFPTRFSSRSNARGEPRIPTRLPIRSNARGETRVDRGGYDPIVCQRCSRPSPSNWTDLARRSPRSRPNRCGHRLKIVICEGKNSHVRDYTRH